MLLVVLGLAVAFAGAIPLALTHVGSLPSPVFWLMALIAGSLGGMVYPLAVSVAQAGGETRQASVDDARRSASAGRLYGADLLGGCLGALLGAAFLVPVLGIPQTCTLIALAALAGLIAIASRR
jgi:spermidine synthase